MEENSAPKFEAKRYTREEVASFLSDIAQRLIAGEDASLHSMLALNQLLRDPNAAELFDEDLREQARDLWLKLKSTGIHLNDPPLLFGSSVSTSIGDGAP